MIEAVLYGDPALREPGVFVNEIDGDEDVDLGGGTNAASAYPPPKCVPTVRHGHFAHQGSTRET